jgi:predicted ATPase/class 3 adenylate cyclase
VSELSSGTVTLLFTDVEGSTRLARDLGERWVGVLAEHRRLLREAFAAHGGHEVDAQGDAFFVAFPRAANAAGAAAAAQRALTEHPWPDGLKLRVRMGIHSGEPIVSDEGYVGVDVHKAARICAAAYGGQVLLSAAARDLLGDVAVKNLGDFRLKDMMRPERLFQLEIEGVPSDFPLPRSLNATNLPTQPSPLIGRHEDVAAALALLRSDDVRLVTLVGAGGTGKTRLALQLAAELADEFADGVYWVPLGPVSEPGIVGDVIARTIGAPVESESFLRSLRDRELLLLLDNFEHVLPAAPLIGDLLAAAPRVKVLATSRAPLHLSGEHELPVLPLGERDAVELFAARAKAVRPTFEDGKATAEICRRVDCIPLAIELAASRLKHLTAESLLARLDRSLAILTGGARDLPERHRTLRATIDWSYQLLEPEEQRLLDRLAVFAGAATIEQAESVCVLEREAGVDVLDGIASLVDKSLLRWYEPDDGPPRYFMLETVHEFALERLAERGEEATIRRRHRDYFLELAERLNPIDRLAGIHELVLERNNLRAALEWSLEEPEGGEGLRLAFILWRYWVETGSITEGRRWLDLALARPHPNDRALEARALDAAAFLAAQQGDFAAALSLSEKGVAIARTLHDAPRILAWCLFRVGQIEVDRGRLAGAQPWLREAAEIFQRERWPLAEAWALIELNRAELLSGRFAEARRGFADVVEVTRGGEEAIAFAYAEVLLGLALSLDGELDDGLAYVEAGLEGLSRLDARFTLADALLHAAPVFYLTSDISRERAALAEALRIALDSGIVPRASSCLEGAARIAADAERYATAARLWGAADESSRELGVVPSPLRLRLREPRERAARSALGEDSFTRELEKGRSTSLVEALGLGLEAIESIEAEGGVTAMPPLVQSA